MMIEIPLDLYSRSIPLFDQDVPNSPMLFAVLEGRYPGHVFVDDRANPTRGVVITTIGFTFIGGWFDQLALNDAIADLRKGRGLSLVWSPPVAGHVMPPSQATREFNRLECFDRRPVPTGAGEGARLLPDGFALRRMEAPLFARCLWRDLHVQMAGTSENFLAHGLGFCLMRDEEIVCEAYAGCLGAGKWEIGAITHEQHRRQGYAGVTCTHLVEMCEGAGQPTCWSCDTDNVASIATARRLGYTPERAYKLLYYAKTA
jgi:GNAT superfamily N-acetyltransferase